MTGKAAAASLCGVLCAGPAFAQGWSARGSLVEVSVQVDGTTAPLYRAPDGSGRYYLEARRGAAYELRLENRSHERLGVVVSVDGLNAVSGERDRSLARPGDPGRMYVLDPWDGTSVRGWRTSLTDVHRFTFVDEQASYAARTGNANARMGWIEVAVYRELRPFVWRRPPVPVTGERSRDEARSQPTAPPATTPPAASAEAPKREALEQDKQRSDAAGSSYPGTGWGTRESDHAVLVEFRPQPAAAERVTLRYEYAPALQRLGLLPPFPARDRLAERESGRDGFAKPPR
jgi:hypothetical protein